MEVDQRELSVAPTRAMLLGRRNARSRSGVIRLISDMLQYLTRAYSIGYRIGICLRCYLEIWERDALTSGRKNDMHCCANNYSFAGRVHNPRHHADILY